MNREPIQGRRCPRWTRTVRALMMALLCSSVGLISSMGPVAAQSPEQERILRDLTSRPSSQWSARDAQLFVRTFVEVLADGMIDYLSAEERARLGRIEIEVARLEGNAPASMVGHRLRLREDFFDRAVQLSVLLAHDLHVEYLGWLPNPDPVVNTPISRTALVPILRPLDRYAESLLLWGACPRQLPGCEALITVSTGAVLGFVIGHELSHRLLGHEPGAGDEYPLALEITADRKAAELLARMRHDLPYRDEDLNEAADHAFAAAPLLILESAREALATEIDEWQKDPKLEAALAARLDAYADSLPRALRELALDSVKAATSDGNAGRLEIVWDEEPDLLVINGLEFSPDGVRGRVLRVAGGSYLVFARRDDRFAFDRELIWESGPARIQLEYEPLVAPGPAHDLRRLEKDREWLELLRRTSDPDLRPSSAAVATYHLAAMRRMGLGAWVDPGGWGLLHGRDLRRVQRTYEGSLPLSDWLR